MVHRLLLRFVFCLVAFGPLWVQAQAPARHVVFLIHGIGGSAARFGHMKTALENHLGQFQAGGPVRFEVQNFEYDTSNDEKDVFLFARELDRKIALAFSDGLNAQDRISFVVFSQGGLIATVWLLKAMERAPGFHPEFADAVDSITTLSTPFWGAKIAGFAAPLKPRLNRWRIPLPTGLQQIKDMSFGSEMIYWLRNKIAEKSPFQRIRLLSLGGYAKWLNRVPGTLGTAVCEDDTVVILPSTRPDFYFGHLLKDHYPSGDFTAATEFRENQFGQYRAVNAVHTSPLIEGPQISRGMGQVQASCVQDLNCSHPTFKTVFEHLTRQNLDTRFDESAKMTSFLLDINVRMPQGHGLMSNQLRVSYELPKDIVVGSRYELRSTGAVATQDGRMIRLYGTGTVRSDLGEIFKRERKILMKVEAPGMKPRRIELPVKAMQSTFVELNLESGS